MQNGKAISMFFAFFLVIRTPHKVEEREKGKINSVTRLTTSNKYSFYRKSRVYKVFNFLNSREDNYSK